MKRGSGNSRNNIANLENKDQRDDDLLLFRDMQKRDKERINSLLQPIPTEDYFESNSPANYSLFRIKSAKKFGFEFLNETEKNDYDWLKTPPATPLFASLEMDACAAPLDLVVQRELPIIGHLSRFSGQQDVPKINNPGQKYSSWSDDDDATVKNTTSNTTGALELTKQVSPPKIIGFSNETPPNLITNRSSSTSRRGPPEPSEHSSRRRSCSTSRGRPLLSSPVIVSKQRCQANPNSNQHSPDPSDIHTRSCRRSPPKENTNAGFLAPNNYSPQAAAAACSTSSSRMSRPTTSPSTKPSQDTRRQSCSPSMSRGRKTQEKMVMMTSRQKKHGGENGSLAFGSSMVDKVINARLSTQDSTTTTPTHHSSSFGRFMSKTQPPPDLNYTDVAVKRESSKRIHGHSVKRDAAKHSTARDDTTSSNPNKYSSTHQGTTTRTQQISKARQMFNENGKTKIDHKILQESKEKKK